MSDVVDGVLNLEQELAELEATTGGGKEWVCQAYVDIGFQAFVTGVNPADAFFSIAKHGGVDGALAAAEAFASSKGQPFKFKPNKPEAAVVILGKDVLNREAPKWEKMLKSAPMISSSDEARQKPDFVPTDYEEYIRPQLASVQAAVGASKLTEILGKPFWGRFKFVPSLYDTRVKNKSYEDARNLLQIIEVFPDEAAAHAYAGGESVAQYPAQPDGWDTSNWGPWNAYFSLMVEVAKKGDALEAYLIPGEGEEGDPVVTKEHIELAAKFAEAESIPF